MGSGSKSKGKRKRQTADTRPVATASVAPTTGAVTIADLQAREMHSVDAALKLPTTWRCVSLITTTISQLQLVARRGNDPMPLPEWLRVPERLGPSSQHELIRDAVTSMAVHGCAYWLARPAGKSWTLDTLPATRVTVTMDTTGARHWRVDGQSIPLAHSASGAAGLIVAPLMLLPTTATPLGPLQIALRSAYMGWQQVEDYAATVFDRGLHSGTYLTTDQHVTAKNLLAYQQAWTDYHSNPLTGRIPVMSDGLRLVNDVVDPKQAQWVESRTWNAQEVCRLYGVPASMVSGLPSGDSQTYATARDNDAAYLRYCVGQYLAPIEHALSSLLPRGRTAAESERVELDTDALMRPTMIDRWQALNQAVSAGWLSVNDAREREGLTPMGMDTELAQLTAQAPRS